MVYIPAHFHHLLVKFVATQMCFSCMFSSDFLHIYTKYALEQRLEDYQFSAPCSAICGHQRTKFIFLMCALQPLVFSESSLNSYQLFVGPRSKSLPIFITHQLYLWSLGSQLHFYYVSRLKGGRHYVFSRGLSICLYIRTYTHTYVPFPFPVQYTESS